MPGGPVVLSETARGDVTLILPFSGKHPRIGAGVFLAPTAAIIGDVEIGPRSSVWFGAVPRGDDLLPPSSG